MTVSPFPAQTLLWRLSNVKAILLLVSELQIQTNFSMIYLSYTVLFQIEDKCTTISLWKA